MISSQRGGQSVNSFTHSGRERVGLSDHKHTHKGGGRTREERGNALSLSLSLSLLLLLSLFLPLFFSLLLDQIRSKSKTNSTREFTRPRTLSFEFLEVVVFFDCYLFRHLLVFVVVHRRHAALSFSFSLSFSLSCAVRSRRRASSPSFSQFSLSPASFSLQMIFFSFRR